MSDWQTTRSEWLEKIHGEHSVIERPHLNRAPETIIVLGRRHAIIAKLLTELLNACVHV